GKEAGEGFHRAFNYDSRAPDAESGWIVRPVNAALRRAVGSFTPWVWAAVLFGFVLRARFPVESTFPRQTWSCFGTMSPSGTSERVVAAALEGAQR
ncbi:MAG: hypothetical protein ABIT01_16680, partial [Thermoanaerobaculia bacterium]